MPTNTQHPAPFSRFSRIGFGLSSKSNSTSARLRKNKQGRTDEEWYIPYNGPYEPPPEVPRKMSERDSWGEQVLDDGAALSNGLFNQRTTKHGRESESVTRVAWKSDGVSGDGDQKKGTRPRSQSVVSGRTTSPSTVDHSRFNTTPQQRRSTVSSTHRHPTTSYINLDASGGVGESPMPQNHTKEGSSTQRSSLFAFGGQARKAPLERISRKLSRPPRSGSGLGIGYTVVSNPPKHSRNSSSGSSLIHDVQPAQTSNTVPPEPQRPQMIDDEDYFHSYYETLLTTPGPDQTEHPPQPPPARTRYVFSTSLSPHPYARVREKPEVHTQSDLPRLTFTDTSLHLQASTSADAARPSAPRVTGTKTLKHSASTPDLRIASNLPLTRTKRLPPKTIGFKDRWLSAETWCDAMFLPRPRLKIKQQDELGFVGSGRIVSPPGSPMVDGGIEPPGKGKGVASRVLAHSRSLADLPKASMPEAGPSSMTLDRMPPVQASLSPVQGASAIPRPPRPRSFAQDDMSLVPSLARVLEDGQILDDQRREWKVQATQSFQNKLSRNISRARSKSLTHRGRHRDEPPPTSLDFLTTRACLGSQSMMPVVMPSRSQDAFSSSRHGSSSKGTFSRSSHSQSNSLCKTISKSSKSHSRTHSRTDSWGKSALKVAKSASVACGITSVDVDLEGAVEISGLEGALRRDDTKVIRLADPVYIPIDKGAKATSTSPVPSASSDVIVGIAVSTPSADDVLDPIRLPRHPYAQGGLYSYRTYGSSIDSPVEQGSDYAGPHPSLTVSQSSANDVSSRHRNPPQALHPYARLSRDSFFDDGRIVPQPRMDSDVPLPAKMWAQWSPGVVREILPNEIQYSPFIPDPIAGNSKNVDDTAGAAVHPQPSKHSGLGTTEDHIVLTQWEISQRLTIAATKRSNRQPVQYDATRPSYLAQSQKPSDPSSSHTVASSALGLSTHPDQQNLSTSVHDLLPVAESPVTTSPSSSSLRPFRNPDDIHSDSYHDLFYRSSRSNEKKPSDEPIASTSVAWEDKLDRSGSGLTSLARQLSQEFHHLSVERDRVSSHYSRASMAVSQHSAFFRRPTDSGLEFVFEEVSPSESQNGASPPDASSLAAFHPSINIPEDVSRSSVQLDPEEDEDETEVYRVGIVESTSTPPATASDQRSSLAGDMSYAHEQLRHPPNALLPESPTQERVNSGLHPPISDPTRSSFLTSSSASRMSGLSDFPAPPRHHAAHMSLLSSFFDEALSQSDTRSSPPPLDERNRRLTFGGADDVEELITALSSQASHSSHTETHTIHS